MNRGKIRQSHVTFCMLKGVVSQQQLGNEVERYKGKANKFNLYRKRASSILNCRVGNLRGVRIYNFPYYLGAMKVILFM